MLTVRTALKGDTMRRLALSFVALLLASVAAQAHTGLGDASGFVHGFSHPIGGIDHVLAMVAVGLLAARLGGRALWLVPLSFVAMMVVGGACGIAGIGLPLVEIAIALSVVVLGVAVGAGCNLPTVAAMALVGLFAVFHGHAHGAEMPETASGYAYGAGFVLATATLHACGIGLGLLVLRLNEARRIGTLRLAGTAMAIAGLALLAGSL